MSAKNEKCSLCGVTFDSTDARITTQGLNGPAHLGCYVKWRDKK